MSRLRTTSLVILTLLLALGMVIPAGALTGVPADSAVKSQDNEAVDTQSTVSVAVGQQLSTVVDATEEEVRSDAADVAFEQQMASSSSTEQAEAVAERAIELDKRASDIRSDYDDLTAAHEAGEIDDETFAQRLASLNTRATSLEESVTSLQKRAAELPDAERRAVNVTDSDLAAITEQVAPVSGPSASALLDQFTGEASGEFEIEHENGLEVEVEQESGEQSRELERPRDGNGTLVLTQSEALDNALDALSGDGGNWTVTESGVDDGAYEFEFEYTGPEAEGEAEVAVDGETGTVFEIEEEIERTDDDDEDDEEGDDDDEEDDEDEEEDDDDEEEDGLALIIVDGTPTPGETITLEATTDGEPVEGVSVTLNEETVGTTGSDGTISLTLPTDDDADIKAEDGEAEAELEFEFEDEEEEEDGELGATADINNGTVTVSVTLNGEPVEGASVVANDDPAGTTASDGTVSFSLPSTDELEIDIDYEDLEAELEYELEDDEEEEEEEDDEEDEDEEEDDEEDDDDEDDDEEGDDDGDEEDGEEDEEDEEDEDDDGDEEDEEDEDDDGDEEDEDDDGDEEDEEDEDDDGDEENEEDGDDEENEEEEEDADDPDDPDDPGDDEDQ